MKIAVTGASGFLGGVIANYLADKGHEIFAHENITSISKLTRSKFSKIINGDLSYPEVQKKLLLGSDMLCHSAAYIPSNMRDFGERSKCFITNTMLTQDLAKQTKELGISRLLFLSTANFYEPNEGAAATEKDLVNVGLAGCLPYFLSKYAAEKSIESLLEKNKYTILRIATPFGVGEPLSKVVPNFLLSAKKNLPIRVLGTGRENINLVFSDDVARAVELAILAKESGIYNISGTSLGVIDLAKKCILAAGGEDQEIVTLNSHGIFSFAKINNKCAQSELNWQPINLDIALKKYSSLLLECHQ